MITILAEKPSVAKAIAQILGATDNKDGYIIGNGYAITWAYGHLVSLAMPNDYGINGYRSEDLPILPEPFQLKIRAIKKGKNYQTDPIAKKQLHCIDKLFKQSKKIIVATDAGREGELIFRYIYDYLNCHKPFERLWISSLTDKAIKEGFSNLQQGSQYDALYEADKARSEADWLVGINASRALSLSAGRDSYSLGRVQTPTLAMLCKRYLENQGFTPVPYWKVQLTFEKDGKDYAAHSEEQFSDLETATQLQQQLQTENTATVASITTKTVTSSPPLLYDLTSLQKDANTKYGFSADKTLSIAQSLYEKKVATYPRTGSRYISEDIFEQIPGLIAQFQEDTDLGKIATFLSSQTLTKFSVNTAKVTDHHAILPTENLPTSLSADEQHIYQLLVRRLLAAFSAVSIKEVTTITLIAHEKTFAIKGEQIKQLGWKALSKDDKVAATLPLLSEKETVPLSAIQTTEHQTKPKPLYTEASLLSAMEFAGKEVEDAQAGQAMKDCGIGTPATRAAIIETLLTREYIERQKKTLVPTAKGLQVYELVKDKKIADAQMTGEWEYTLSQIEQRKILPEDFRCSITRYTTKVTEELLALHIPQAEAPHYECPLCKAQSVLLYPKIAKCSNEQCGFKVFRTVCKRLLSEKEIISLLQTGKTPLLKGLQSKAGNSFSAYLILDDKGTTAFEFPKKYSKNKRAYGKK